MHHLGHVVNETNGRCGIDQCCLSSFPEISVGWLSCYLARRGEEHSFILKPAASFWKSNKSHSEKSSQSSSLAAGNAASTWRHSSYSEGKQSGSSADHYAILVSCRSNYIGMNCCLLSSMYPRG